MYCQYVHVHHIMYTCTMYVHVHVHMYIHYMLTNVHVHVYTCTCTCTCRSNFEDQGSVLRGWFHVVLAGDIVEWTAPLLVHRIHTGSIADEFLHTPCVASSQGHVQRSLSIVILSVNLTTSLSVCAWVGVVRPLVTALLYNAHVQCTCIYMCMYIEGTYNLKCTSTFVHVHVYTCVTNVTFLASFSGYELCVAVCTYMYMYM